MDKSDSSGTPNYVTKKPAFSCPVGTGIAWHWGLSYSSCPVASDQRDMGACQNCHLRGEGRWKSSKARGGGGVKDQPDAIKRRKKKEAIPNIKKTYTSE